jgi:HSP20 family protein
MGSFHREVDNLIDRFFGDFRMGPLGLSEHFGGGDFMPRVDISENDKAIKVTAELPGMDENDIDITLTHDSLTIKGEKKEETEEKEKDFYRMECRYGSFHRVIPLSTEVDETKAEADFKKGVLKITLPKTPEAQQARRKIKVNAV